MAVGVAALPAMGEEPKPADVRPYGIEQRVPWTTSRVKGSPDPPLPYHVERVFPKLAFNNPVELTPAPGSDRLFVLEVGGKIYSFSNRQDADKLDLALDIKQAIKGVGNCYGFEFHPNFEQNRYCYVCYVIGSNIPDGTHVSRFTVNKTDPPTIDPESEKSIITWPSGGHNGGCLKFGNDGYLYISTGDGTGPNPPDILKTGQDVSDLLSSVLRIDVDHPDEGKGYAVPSDNPFIKVDKARPEIWAYGFRNPWKMNFDSRTGRLWLGDVGWELWELVYHVRSGGNYGWSAVEGPQPVYTYVDRGPSPITAPTVAHPHSEAASITGGHVYYGDRLKELHGAYLYGDYETGKIWALRYDGQKVALLREIADTTLKLVCFGLDHDNRFYIVGYTPGEIYRLVPNPALESKHDFPVRLSQTGLFDSVQDQTPAPGVIPYSINSPPWSDGASSERFVALPEQTTIDTKPSPWKFPQDAVLAKTISIDTEPGNSQSRRRLETQLLHYDGEAWKGYTYRWNDQQTDATLVDAEGGQVTLSIKDAAAPGGERQQTWHFPSRTECMRCHNPWSGNVLAFNVPQLNKLHRYPHAADNQLRTFAHVALTDRDLSKGDNVPALADPRDEQADLSARARAYLHTNCAHCHRMHAGSSVLSKMHYDLPLDKTLMVDERPSQGTFGLVSARVVAPGDPFRSVLWYRMSKLGRGRMPHIGSTQVDPAGTRLIYDWINQLEPSAATADAADQEDDVAIEIGKLSADNKAPAERQASAVDRLLSSTGGALRTLYAIEQSEISAPLRQLIIDRGTQHSESQIRDLFERFIPEQQRIKRLGSTIKPEQILSLKGDQRRGSDLFLRAAGVTCRNCHRVGKTGQELGPDLRAVAEKNSRAQLLESLLTPSKKIDEKFAAYLIETKRGKVHTGLLIKNGDQEVVLKDTSHKEIRVPRNEIELMERQQKSLMPDLLLRDMTAQEVADLLAFLKSLNGKSE